MSEEEQKVRCFQCFYRWKESELIGGYKCPNCGCTAQEPA